MLRYEVRQRVGESVVLALQGEMVGDLPIDRLQEALEDHYVDDGVKRILIDLQAVSFVTLEGIGMLLELWRESNRRGKVFRVEHPQRQVAAKLQETGVLKCDCDLTKTRHK